MRIINIFIIENVKEGNGNDLNLLLKVAKSSKTIVITSSTDIYNHLSEWLDSRIFKAKMCFFDKNEPKDVYVLANFMEGLNFSIEPFDSNLPVLSLLEIRPMGFLTKSIIKCFISEKMSLYFFDSFVDDILKMNSNYQINVDSGQLKFHSKPFFELKTGSSDNFWYASEA